MSATSQPAMMRLPHRHRKIYRWEIPVDDQEHEIEAPPIAGIHKVTAIGHDRIEFWAIVDTDAPTVTNTFTVVATGHLIYGDEWLYVGTADRTPSGLVWHLLKHHPLQPIVLTLGPGENQLTEQK